MGRAWRVRRMNVQKHPSNGSRDTADNARRASSKVSLITGQSKPNLHPFVAHAW